MSRRRDEGPVIYALGRDVFGHRGFTSYEEMRLARAADGAFSIPCRHRYVVAAENAVHESGLDPTDPDRDRIGRNRVRPEDAEAWEPLELRRETAP